MFAFRVTASPVILHDADVDRTTDGSAPIAGVTVAEINSLDAGKGETIPTLEEVLDVVSLALQVEIKDRAAVSATAELIRQRDLVAKVFLTSFSTEALSDAARLFPESRLALIMSDCPPDAVELAIAVDAVDVCTGLKHASRELVSAFQTQGARVCVWPANDEDEMRQAVATGADAVTTNYPHLKSAVTRSTTR